MAGDLNPRRDYPDYPPEYFWEQLRRVLARSDEKQRDLSKVGRSYRLKKEDFLREHR